MSLHGGTDRNKAIDSAFKAGYKEGLKDSKLLEMLKEAQEMLYRCQSPATATTRLGDEIGNLIKDYENNT